MPGRAEASGRAETAGEAPGRVAFAQRRPLAVIALAVLRPHVPQQPEGFRRLDPAGDDLLVHALGDVVDRLHEDPVAVVDGQIADDAALDLDVVGIEALEVVERAEAGAEIPEREPAPDVLELAHESERV